MPGFNIYKLNARKIIDNMIKTIDENNKAHYSYNVDLTQRNKYRVYVSSCEEHSCRAAFYQIVKILSGPETDISDEAFLSNLNNPGFIQSSIVELDFGSLKMEDNDMKESPTFILLDNGFSIRFPGEDNFKQFVAYDKSNSMSRNKRIYFIDETLMEKLNRRFMLDINDIQVPLSKLYAYKGLYYSDACRIENLELNENTVVVIPDDKVKVETYYFTKDNDEQFVSKTEDLYLEPFDGVGLISNEYADIISEQLDTEFKCNSFQIRLPFAKGMVHKANWQKLIHEIFSDAVDGVMYEDARIIDVFGIERKLIGIQMIIPQSMFKCKHWLEKFCKNNNIEDCMQYYFDKFREYSHALYISGSDATLKNTGKALYNYQFINPLDMPKETFNEMVKRYYDSLDMLDPMNVCSLEEIKSERNMEHFIRLEQLRSFFYSPKINEDEYGDDYDEDKREIDEEMEDEHIPAWLSLISKYPILLYDPYIRNMLNEKRKHMAIDAIRGRILVEGETRYLCCDLVSFVIHIVRQLKDYKEDENIKENMDNKLMANWIPKTISSSAIYAPGSKSLDGKKAALFRNPHLSRNEECLVFYNDKTDKHGPYRYFSHLKDVIMIGRKSTVAMALGGADFDGDEVRVIYNKDIVDSVERGLYENGIWEETENGRKINRRFVPVVNIPSGSAKDATITAKTDPTVICRTFAGQIGRISNQAIRFGVLEYAGSEKEREEFKNKCAECAILTGLEIDAAKTGVRPDLSGIFKYWKLSDKDDYIKKMKFMCDHVKKINVRLTQNNKYIITKGYKKDNADKSNIVTLDIDQLRNGRTANIDLLPLLYADYITSRAAQKELYKNIENDLLQGRDIIDFIFDLPDEKWRKKIYEEEPEKIDGLYTLITDMRRIDNKAKKMLSIYRNNEEVSKLDNEIYKLLLLRFDSLNQQLCYADETEEAVTVEQALKNVLVDVKEAIGNKKDVNKCIKRIQKEKWIFTPESKRKEKLGRILDPDGSKYFLENAAPGTIELLTFFGNQNYELLEKIVNSVKNDLPDSSETNSIENTFGELYKNYIPQKILKKKWNELLVSECRNKIAELFDCSTEDLSSAVKYVLAFRKTMDENDSKEPKWSVDQNGNFMWTIFTPREIERAINTGEVIC